MSITSDNNLIITFNDTLVITNITQDDLYINIYGTQTSYSFSWTASYTDSFNVLVTLDIQSEIMGGNNEYIVLEFTNDTAFTSLYSQRGVNNEVQHTQYLNSNDGVEAAQSFGQAALVIFFTSLFLALISSFGGNSMEMMWNMTNTLQIFYYMSKIYVRFPDFVNEFFSYLKYSNANNSYLTRLCFLIISDSHFKRGNVNDRIEEKAFYLSSSDKIPWLIPLIFLFLIIKIFD